MEFTDEQLDRFRERLSTIHRKMFCKWLRPFRDAIASKKHVGKSISSHWTDHQQGTLDTYNFILRQMGDKEDD